MHELSVAESILEQVEELAAREGADGVNRVTVSVGSLSGVEPDALEFAFPVALETSGLDGVELVIERVPAHMKCAACGRTTEPEFPFAVCAHCGSAEVECLGGRELLIQSVELLKPAGRAKESA
jgi:hydrogenase nickel incorporation protein HypA/HybF